ncbi:MAG: ADP-ribose diphosphatase [Gemmatimonas sp.]
MSESETPSRKVDIMEKRVAYHGYFRIDRYRLRHELFGGGMSKPIQREVFERGHAVGLLPYDPVRDVVVLIEQFRIGAYAAGFDPWMLEIVAGIIEDGETPEDVARRESSEEANLTLTDILPICRYIASPGGASESVRVFLGRVDASAAGGIHGLNHEDEDIRVVPMPWAEARRLLDDGRMYNALGVVALQWLALHRDEIRAKWR